MDAENESSTNLLVRFLDHAIDDDAFRKFFVPYGTVLASIVQRDIHTGQSRGFGFVRFSTHSEALMALQKTNDTLLGRKHINVFWAKKQHDDIPVGEERVKMNKLFVRNVPTKITDETLSRVFSEFGVVDHVSVHSDTSVARRPMPASAQRHIAFITFAEAGAAERAFKKMHNTMPFKCCAGVPLMCKLSENYQDRNNGNNSGDNNGNNNGNGKLRVAAPMYLSPENFAADENGSENSAHLNVVGLPVPAIYAENICSRPTINHMRTQSEAMLTKPGLSPYRPHHERTCSAVSNWSIGEQIDGAAAAPWWHGTVSAPPQQEMPDGTPLSGQQIGIPSTVKAPTHLYYSCSAHRARNPNTVFAPPPSPRLARSASSEELQASGVSTPSSGRYFHNPYAVSCLEE